MNIYSTDLFIYILIHLLAVIVKEDSVSDQSNIDLFRYGLIHLQTAIEKSAVTLV